MPFIQGLLNKFKRLSKERGLDNVMVEGENGSRLAGIVKAIAEKTRTSDSNIIILGETNVLGKSSFDSFREGMDPERWAFFAEVEVPEKFPENNYIRLLEMLTKAVNLWAGKPKPADPRFMKIVRGGNRLFRFIIPQIEPMDYNMLREIYSGQLEAIKSA